MNESILEHTINQALKHNPSFASVRGETHKLSHYLLKNGVIEAVSSSVESGYNVKMLLNGALSFSSTNIWSKEEAESIVSSATKQAKNTKRASKIDFGVEKGIKDAWKVEEKKALRNTDESEIIKRLEGIDKALSDLKLKIPGRIFSFGIDETEKIIMNSEGSIIKANYTKISLHSFITIMENNKSKQFYKMYGHTGGLEAFDEWHVEDDLKNECLVQKKIIYEGVSLEPGKYTIICGPEVAGITAHESSGHPMEADRILGRELSQAGGSFVTIDSIGNTIGSEYATVVDDPTIPNSYGYFKYDDEGTKAQKKYLYKNGKINEFLQNRESASKSSMKTNGSSRAESYDVEDIVRMSNTYIEPGDWSKEELIKEVKKGVYMKSFTEWNIDDKRFNQKYVAREAYLIVNGEIKQPLNRCVLEISTPNYWKSITASSKELEWSAATCGKGDPEQGVPVFTGGPTIRLEGVYLYE